MRGLGFLVRKGILLLGRLVRILGPGLGQGRAEEGRMGLLVCSGQQRGKVGCWG